MARNWRRSLRRAIPATMAVPETNLAVKPVEARLEAEGETAVEALFKITPEKWMV
jgi:hypothetical protein